MCTAIASTTRKIINLVLFVIIIWTNVSYCDDIGRILDDLAANCPFLSTCSRPPRQEFTSSLSDFTPCCQQCSCSPLCHVEGNCCPDVSHNSTDTPGISTQDVKTQCIPSVYPESPTANGYSSHDLYKAVVTCPDNYPDNDIANKCTAEDPETIEDATLVSDDKNTVYRNIHCAQCNEAQGVKRWTTMIRCIDTDEPVKVDLSHILKRKCKLISAPLSQSLQNVRKQRCFEPDFYTCNITGNWKIYDEFIERACHTVNSMYFEFNTVFKNVFCFLCNGYSSVDDTCLAVNKRESSYPFTAIIDPTVVGWDQDTKRCKRIDIYDPFSMTCRELICPPHLSAVNGECVRAFAQTDGFHVNFLVMVKPVDTLKSAPTETESQSIMTMAHHHLTDKIRKRGCKLCSSWGNSVETAMANYILQLNIMTTPSCPLPFLISKTEVARGANLSVDMNSVTIDFIVYSFDNKDGSLPKFSSVSAWFKSDSFCVGYGLPFQAFDSCPRVQVSGLDYMAANENSYTRNTTLLDQYNLSNFTEEQLANVTFEICVSDYFQSASNAYLDKHAFSLSVYHVGTFVSLSILSCAITIAYRVVSPHPQANSCIIAANLCLIAVQCLLFFIAVVVSERLHCAMIKFAYQLTWLVIVMIAHLYNILALIPYLKKRALLTAIYTVTVVTVATAVSLMTYSFRAVLEEPDCGGLFLYKADMTSSISAFFIVIIPIVFMETILFLVVREWRETGRDFFFFLGLVALSWTTGCLHDVYGDPYIGLLFYVFSCVLGIYMFGVFGPLIRILTINNQCSDGK